MAFLFGKKKGNHRDGTPNVSATSAPVTTPPSSLNNSLNSLSDVAGSPSSRALAQNVAPRGMHQAHNSDATPPGSSQGRGLQQKQQSPQGPQQYSPSSASLYPWSQRRLTLNPSHPSPFPRYGHAANAVASKDGDIYIMGGLIRSQNVRGDLWMVEGESERLESYPVMTTSEGPGPRVGHASLLVGNAFIVFGGDTKLDERDVLDETLYLLNTSTRQWSRASPHGRPSGRYGHTLNILGSKLYIFGGQVDTVFFNDLVAFDLNTLQHAGSKWDVLVAAGEGNGDVPASRTNHTIVTWNDRLYLFGGTNGVEWFNDVWSYDPRTNQWTQLDCIGFIPPPREGHAAALVGDVMYVFGGRSSEGTDLGDLAAFRISSRRWYTFQNMGPSPSPRSGHTMSTVGSKIIVLGGEPSVPARSQEELQLVYVLDTAKIRYPSDNPNQASPTDRNRPAGNGPPRATQGLRNGSVDAGPGQDPRRPPPKQGGPPREGLMGPSQPPNVSPPGGLGGPGVSGGPGGPGGPSGPVGPGGPGGPGGSRLPRASLANQQSGPPPSQQAPTPRPNGAPPGADPRSKPHGGPAPKGKENTPGMQPRENPASMATNGVRGPMGQRKVSGESGPPPGRTGSRQQQHRQQPSIESMEGPISEEPELQSPNATKLQPHPEPAREERPSLDVRDLSDQPSIEESSPEPPMAKEPPVAERTVDSEEVEKLRSMNDWYASELALARRAGYTPQSTNSALLDRRRESLADDERPIIEAMLSLKGELTKVQVQLDQQSALAAKKMQEIERQRDVAIQEAVYAKAKLAALGGSAPVQGEKGFDSASMDAEKMTDMSRKLAASLSAQADLSAKCQALTAEVASERKARHLADEMASTAQRRISELDEYRNRAASEIENLRAELLDAGKAYREEAAAGQEAASDAKLLRIDQTELTARLEEVVVENKSYQASLEHLSKAMQVNNGKNAMLERQLEEERQVKEALERKLGQLRSEYEEKTADLQNMNQRLKDVEELMETYAEEARVANACLAAGLDKVAAREPPSMLASVTEERVLVLQEQVTNTQNLLAKSKAQADETGEKLAEAMQRVAGLEFQQGQASKDAIALRRRMAEISDEARRLKQENVDLINQLDRKQLEVDAVTAKHNALKEILNERGSLAGLEKRLSTSLQATSPESGTATPEQLNRLRDLEARLEESLRAHRETKNSAEMQAQEVEKHFREKLEQLENDYQSAVHYVKGTEKMLKRMKEELTKYKAQNVKLQQELEQAQSKGDKHDTIRSSDSEADWEQERELLNKEIDDLRIKVRESAMALDKQIRDTKNQLDALREERDQLQAQHSQMQTQVTEFATALEKLEGENQVLAHRAESAEHKVSMLLDQVENSVDAYRRSMRFEGQNGVPESARSSYYAGPDNRTSVALDSLASELDALRTHWESTNKTYRLSNTFDFEKSPTTPQQSDFSTNISQWRQKLAEEEEEDGERTPIMGSPVKNGFHAPTKPTAATVAAGGGVI